MIRPTIRILKPGDETALEIFLLSQVESSMFLVANLRRSGLVDSGEPYTGAYAAAFEDERVVGVVAHYWNQNLVFQAPVHADPLWRAAVEASRRPVGGLIGPNSQVTPAKAALEIDAAQIQMDEVEKLYSLRLEDLRVPEGLSSGRLRGRPIEPRDLELITQWEIAYSVEALGDQDSPHLREACRIRAGRFLQEGRTWVLEAQGKPVARSSFNAAIKEAVQVGGVWTPPELRRRGYGRSVVAASLSAARAQGVEQAVLFTGESNLAAQNAYAALGFEPIGNYRLVLLKSPVKLL